MDRKKKINKNELLKFKTWSTFVYLVPFFIALHYQIWITVIPLGLLTLVCLEYHFSKEKKFGILDHFLAWTVILTNTIICYLGGFSMPFFGITIACVVISVVIYTNFTEKKHYNTMHGIWHIASALITVFSILTYVFSKGF